MGSNCSGKATSCPLLNTHIIVLSQYLLGIGWFFLLSLLSVAYLHLQDSGLILVTIIIVALYHWRAGQVSGRLLRVHGGWDEGTSPQEDLQWGRKGLQCASWWWWCWMWKMTKNVIIDSMNMILVSHLWRQRWWAWSIWRGGTQSTLRGEGRLLANNPTMGWSPSHLNS